jgi:hypothetical protein
MGLLNYLANGLDKRSPRKRTYSDDEIAFLRTIFEAKEPIDRDIAKRCDPRQVNVLSTLLRDLEKYSIMAELKDSPNLLVPTPFGITWIEGILRQQPGRTF